MKKNIYFCPKCGSKHVQSGHRLPQKGVPVTIIWCKCLECGYGGQRIIQ